MIILLSLSIIILSGTCIILNLRLDRVNRSMLGIIRELNVMLNLNKQLCYRLKEREINT